MTMRPDDDPLSGFAALPAHDLDSAGAERIRRRAQATLARERRLAERPWLAASARAWNGTLEPALALAAVAAYLVWMVGTVAPLVSSYG